MSSDQPPPRNTNGLPLTRNCREPFGAIGAGPTRRVETVRIPNVSDWLSGGPPWLETLILSPYSGWAPIW